jgi:hypothetical protein
MTRFNRMSVAHLNPSLASQLLQGEFAGDTVNVGAAEGCDLLILSNGYTHYPTNRRQTKTPGINRAFCIDLINERGK